MAVPKWELSTKGNIVIAEVCHNLVFYLPSLLQTPPRQRLPLEGRNSAVGFFGLFFNLSNQQLPTPIPCLSWEASLWLFRILTALADSSNLTPYVPSLAIHA